MRRRIAVFSSPGELIRRAWNITETEQVGGSGPTRVFPLGCGRESIFVTHGQASGCTLTFGDGSTVVAGIEESDLFHRPVGIPGEVAGVPSQDGGEFALRDLIFSDPKIASNCDGILDSHKIASPYQDHVRQWNQLRFRC